jgi:hypothetical protein
VQLMHKIAKCKYLFGLSRRAVVFHIQLQSYKIKLGVL